MQWNLRATWRSKCQALDLALMVNKVVAADWNQATTCSALWWSLDHAMSRPHSSLWHLACSARRFDVWKGCGWCTTGWYLERKPTMRKSVWGIDAPSGQGLCVEMKVLAMHVSQTQDPWFVYTFKHVVKDILRTASFVERSIVVRSSFFSDICERGSNFPGIQERLFNRGDYWLFLICKDLSSMQSFL